MGIHWRFSSTTVTDGGESIGMGELREDYVRGVVRPSEVRLP